MRNFRLTLCYDGSRYSGWQKQGNTGNTIQEKIEALLTRLLGSAGGDCRLRQDGRGRSRKAAGLLIPGRDGHGLCGASRAVAAVPARRTSARSRLRKRRRGFMRGFPARRRATSTVYGTVTRRTCSSGNTSTVIPACSIRTRCAVSAGAPLGSTISRPSARTGT